MPTFPRGAYSPIGAVSRRKDKLDIFVVANDGNVWIAAWEPHFNSCHGWYMIGGASFPPGSPVYPFPAALTSSTFSPPTSTATF